MPFDKNQPSYQALRAVLSERTSRIVAWTGAGLSAAAGLPTWKDLRERLTATLLRKAATFEDNTRDQREAEAKRIAAFSNYWVAFGLLQKALGDTTYAATIREALIGANTVEVPEAYLLLWRLRLAGLLNMNLDRLATRAFVLARPAVVPAEFNSRAVRELTHVLTSTTPWIYNLHGQSEDASSWVFTHDELKHLQQNEGYANFVRSAASTSTLLLAGVTADDVALGGHLEYLTRLGISTGPHYWFTDRIDGPTDDWAEAAGVRVIRYRSKDGDHSELLEALRDLASYVPPENDSNVVPVVIEADLPPAVLPEASDLAALDTETVRLLLNRQATEILHEDSPESIAAYESFVEEYDEAIHKAWYTSTKPPRNVLLGYTLTEEIAKGAFGRVFRATAPDGVVVAVKVLLMEVREEPDLLHSFRRGVRSMKILSRRGAAGMVPYLEASEIPAFVVMQWVEGSNLQDAVLAGRLEDWQSRLRLATQLVGIIHAAHSLPERVLHRDIRPPNIMLEGVWAGDDWRVMVLDFDLSWHKGSFEKSVIYGSSTAGYLAPEQVQDIKGASSRNAAVDAFGLGMTLYFIVSKTHPAANEHLTAGWVEKVAQASRRVPAKSWASLTGRFARLIANATRHTQSERWDISQMESELLRLRQAYECPEAVRAADLLAEELAARTDGMDGYSWDENRHSALRYAPGGAQVELRGVPSERVVTASLSWMSSRTEEFKRVNRWIPQAASAARDILNAGGWTEMHYDVDRTTIAMTFAIDVETLASSMLKAAGTLNRAIAQLRFE